LQELTEIDAAIARLAESTLPFIDRFTSRVLDRLNELESGEDEPLFAGEEEPLAVDRASD
jgi:hypothetical protein